MTVGGNKLVNITSNNDNTTYLQSIADAFTGANQAWSEAEGVTSCNPSSYNAKTVLLQNTNGFYLRIWCADDGTYVNFVKTKTASNSSEFNIYADNLNWFKRDGSNYYNTIGDYPPIFFALSKSTIPQDLGTYDTGDTDGFVGVFSPYSSHSSSGTSSSSYSIGYFGKQYRKLKLIIGTDKVAVVWAYSDSITSSNQRCSIFGNIIGETVSNEDTEKLAFISFRNNNISSSSNNIVYSYLVKDGNGTKHVAKYDQTDIAKTSIDTDLVYNNFHNNYHKLDASYESNKVPYMSIPLYCWPDTYENSTDILSGNGIGLKGFLDTDFIRVVSPAVCQNVGTTYNSGNFVLATEGILIGYDPSNDVLY